jgi:hypothetical protein
MNRCLILPGNEKIDNISATDEKMDNISATDEKIDNISATDELISHHIRLYWCSA